MLLLLSGFPFDHIDQPLAGSREIVILEAADFDRARLDRGGRFRDGREVPHDMGDAVLFRLLIPRTGTHHHTHIGNG